MRALCCALLLVSTLGASPVVTDASRLDPLRPLIGGRWIGGGFFPGIGNYSTTREFEWTLDGKFIQMRHTLTLRDSVYTETAYLGWDPQRRVIALWGFASDGTLSSAAQVPTKDGAILIEGNTLGDSTLHWRSIFRASRDELRVLTEIERKGSWIPYTSAKYRREAGSGRG